MLPKFRMLSIRAFSDGDTVPIIRFISCRPKKKLKFSSLILRHQFYLPTELTAEGVVVDNSVVDGEGDLVDSRSMITFFRFLSESQNLYLF